MHLTQYTDYSLRVLMYLRIHSEGLSTVNEISEFFQLPKNHIVKVVSNLSRLQLIHSQRGHGGGIRISDDINKHRIGDLVKVLEPDKGLVQCINKQGEACKITHACKLNGILDVALERFYEELNQYTLDDVVLLHDPGNTTIDLTLSLPN